MGVNIGRIHLQPRGVISRRCGLLPTFFGYLFFFISIVIYRHCEMKVFTDWTCVGVSCGHSYGTSRWEMMMMVMMLMIQVMTSWYRACCLTPRLHEVSCLTGGKRTATPCWTAAPGKSNHDNASVSIYCTSRSQFNPLQCSNNNNNNSSSLR